MAVGSTDACVAFVLSVILYWNTLGGGLLYDDEVAVVRNPCVTDNRTSLSDVFTRDFWGHPLYMAGSHKSYRPLSTWTMRAQVLSSSEYLASSARMTNLPTVALHLFNVLSFAFTSSLFALVCHRMFPFLRYRDPLYFLPRFSTLLFIVHPIHVEAVANIVGRCEILSGMFLLLSLLFYMNSAARSYTLLFDGQVRDEAPQLYFSMLHHLGAVACVVLAVLSKEQGATAIGVWVVYELLHAYLDAAAAADPEDSPKAILLRYIGAPESVVARKGLCYRLVANILTLAAILYARLRMNRHMPKFTASENVVAVHPDPYVRSLSYSFVNLTNVWFLIFPWNLTIDWALGSLPGGLIESIWDGRMLAVLAIASSLLLLVTELPARADRLPVLLGMALMIIPFIPSSNLFFPVGFLWAERVLFTPSAGFCILMAVVFQKARGMVGVGTNWKRALLPAILLCLYAGRTLRRNADWRDGYTLYQSAVDVLPLSARNHHGIGTVYSHDVDQLDKAEQHFRKAFELLPVYGETINSLALLLSKQPGREEEAKDLYREAVRVTPGLNRPSLNLAGLLVDMNVGPNVNMTEVAEAERLYRDASMLPMMTVDKRYDTFVRLGSICLKQGKFRAAAEAFQNAVALQDHVQDGTALGVLGSLHAMMGRHGVAKRFYERSLQQQYNRDFAEKDLALLRDRGPEYLADSLQVSMCNRLYPTVRDRMLRSVAYHDDDFAAQRKEVIVVFEDEVMETKLREFCHNNFLDDESCAGLLVRLKEEEQKMTADARKNGEPLGEVKYNVVVDNTEDVSFTMDGHMIRLNVAPKDDPFALTNRVCEKHAVQEADCKVLADHVVQARDRAMQQAQEKAKRNPWNLKDVCKAYAFAEARGLLGYLENKRNLGGSEMQGILQQVRSNVSLGVLGGLYHEKAQRAAQNDLALAKRYLEDAVFYAAYVLQTGAGRYEVDFDAIIRDHLTVARGMLSAATAAGNDDAIATSQLWDAAARYKEHAPAASRVAIVSLCQYDPQHTPLGMVSAHNKVNYGRRHGHPLFIEPMTLEKERPPAWGKIKIVQKYLSMPDQYDWVVWTDCDSFFMNQSLSLSHLLSPEVTDGADLVVSKDGVMLNTGFFAVRPGEWSRQFLDQVYGTEDSIFVWHPWWEQASMSFHLNHMKDEERAQHVRYFPQRVWNGYPKEYSNPIHGHYHEGDFVVAFSGCATYIAQEECNRLFEEYSQRAQ